MNHEFLEETNNTEVSGSELVAKHKCDFCISCSQKESAGCCFEICQSGSRTLSSETELNKMFCVIKEEIKF